MLSKHPWPSLFLVAILIGIAILACLTLTVVTIILKRHNAHQDAQQVAREDSPMEGYCTFERSFHGSFADDAPTRAAGMLVIPKKFLNQQEGRKGDAPATSAKDGCLHQAGGNCHDERRLLSKPMRTPARRALFSLQGDGVHNEGLSEDGTLTPGTISVAGSQVGDYADEMTSVTSSLVTQAPARQKSKIDEAKKSCVHTQREELVFVMSV